MPVSPIWHTWAWHNGRHEKRHELPHEGLHGSMRPLTTTPAVSHRMSRQRSRNTQVEVLLRKELHRAGLRFRLHRRPVPGLRREADIVFGPARVAVFVDGCYWHGCPQHATWPKTNADFWREKINRNRERDRDTDQKLVDVGWLPIRVWEHEDPAEAAENIVVAVRERRQSLRA